MKRWLRLGYAGVVVGLQCGLVHAGAEPAPVLWLHAGQAQALAPLMVRGSQVGLAEVDALGDFILPTITAMEAQPALDSWAEFTAQIPHKGTYYLWGRFRSPTGSDALLILPANATPGVAGLILGASGVDTRRWHWDGGQPGAGRLRVELPAGPWTFRVCLNRSVATAFGPLRWRQAELTQSPRLNALCLTADPDYVPTDAEAQRALGVSKSQPVEPAVTRALFAPGPADNQCVEQRQRVPDWMRVPRWFTKDSWRAELQHRQAGDIAALVREVAANGGEALRLSVFWGGEAYFQSRVAPHAPGLGQLDYLREALDAAAHNGVKVVVYINPNALQPGHPLFEACALRDPDGRISQQPAYSANFQPGSRYACTK